MSKYPGQELSIEQLFHAVNEKLIERAQPGRFAESDSQTSDIHKHLSKTSAHVRFLENSLRPFHRLHPDIIIEISQYLDPRACSTGYAPLLLGSQICRSWRIVLVSQPSLWSFIDGSCPGLIPCFLSRSNDAHLDAHIVSRRVEEVISYINPHIHRLGSLHVELDPNDDSQLAALRGLKPAPVLRHLNIECPKFLEINRLGFTPGIIEPILSLHHLQLFGIRVTPQLAQLTNLTFVSLDVRGGTLRVPLDLLSRNPLLKVVHLWGEHTNSSEDNGHPPGSISLPHLKVLLSGMTPLVDLEALSPPCGARIFSGFTPGSGPNHQSGTRIAHFPIPASFSNLRDLRKLCLVDRGEIYVKLEGEDGSITYFITNKLLQAGTFIGLPVQDVTEATYEATPLFLRPSPSAPATSQRLVYHIVCGMTRLQKLELSNCTAEQVEYFLLVLHSINVCKDLKFLVLSHCVQPHQWMRGLVTMTESRKAAGMGLDGVRIVHSNIEFLKAKFKQEDVRRLRHAVGVLEYDQAEEGRGGRSSLRFDPDLGVAQPRMFF